MGQIYDSIAILLHGNLFQELAESCAVVGFRLFLALALAEHVGIIREQYFVNLRLFVIADICDH